MDFKCFLLGLDEEETMLRNMSKNSHFLIFIISRISFFKIKRLFKETLWIDIIDNMKESCQILVGYSFF